MLNLFKIIISRHAFDFHLELPGGGGGDVNREHRTDPMWGSLSISQDDDAGSGKFRRFVIHSFIHSNFFTFLLDWNFSICNVILFKNLLYN